MRYGSAASYVVVALVALALGVAGRGGFRDEPGRPQCREGGGGARLSAVDDADAVISYLVANLRDQWLARTMRQYRAASSACRRAR